VRDPELPRIRVRERLRAVNLDDAFLTFSMMHHWLILFGRSVFFFKGSD
jgi:hypothetical protein